MICKLKLVFPIALLFFLCHFDIQAQTENGSIMLVSKGKYTNGTEVKKLHKFEDHYKLNQNLYPHFLKFNYNRKAQKFLNYLSAGIFTASIIDGLRDTDFRGTQLFFRRLRPGIIWGGSAALIGNLIAGGAKNQHKEVLLSSRFSSIEQPENSLVELNSPFKMLSKHNFTDGLKTGKLHEMGHVFQNDYELKNLFDEFNKARRKQNTANTASTSIGIIGVGTSIIVANNQDDPLSKGLSIIFLGGSAIVIGGSIALIGNVTSGVKKGTAKSTLLSRVGVENGLSMMPKSQLYFGLGEYGLGITLVF